MLLECSEVAGKTVQAIKIFEDEVEGCEAVIEFTDETFFSISLIYQPAVKAALYKGGIGEPEIVCDYNL